MKHFASLHTLYCIVILPAMQKTQTKKVIIPVYFTRKELDEFSQIATKRGLTLQEYFEMVLEEIMTKSADKSYLHSKH